MNEQPVRCQIVPLPQQQASFQVEGVERLRWHFGAQYPRPFFYPLVGPSGAALTRMGHPGAPNHDHHRSIWFAHQKVLGIDFWSDGTEARIQQEQWLCYQDGDEEAAMASRLGWYDGHDPQPLLEQELVACVQPGSEGETFVELQATFVPAAGRLEFGQTNFGFLAVRVAKSISAFFGTGELTNSESRRGERAIFGTRARWTDYSGPVAAGQGPARSARVEGITYFDHPYNPGYPSAWHVREDGWMGASVCMHQPRETTQDNPLTLRYLLHAHAGPLDPDKAAAIAEQFAGRPVFSVKRATARHRQYQLRRKSSG